MSSSSSQSEHQSDEQSLTEEHKTIPEEGESVEEEEHTKPEECFCSLFDTDVYKPTLEEYQQGKLKEYPLFPNVLTLDNDEGQVCIEKPTDHATILLTGFGIRNYSSLQDALQSEERKRLYEIYKSQKPTDKDQDEDESSATTSSGTMASLPKKESKKSVETETEISSIHSDSTVQQEKVRYLMGLEEEGWEEEAYPEQADLLRTMFSKASEDKFLFAETVTMRSAQIYLRSHRIFDFFQYIITHLLSVAPDNPITFILVLLNKILLYRSGTGHPPLLYERKHIEQLFRLMDRMGTGYIEIKQYESGMNTLGICEYNKKPLLSEEGMVSMEVFVQEALESETALFNDLIKRKWTGSKPKPQSTFSDTDSPGRSFISGSHLIPSDLMLRGGKHFPSTNMLEENVEG